MGGVPLALAGILLPVWLDVVSPQTDRLVPGRQAAYELSAGAVRIHAFDVEAGQFVRLTAIQDGVDLAVGRDIRAGVDPSLPEEEREIQDRLSAAIDRQQRLSQRPQTEEQTRAMSRTVQRLTSEWAAFQLQGEWR